jgi:hypothetical protein
LEGYEPDEEDLKLFAAFAEGELTAEECIRIIIEQAHKAEDGE